MSRPPQNPLEEAIAPELTGGKVYVLDRRDLAKRAALDTRRQAVDSSPARSPRWQRITNGLATKPAPPLSARPNGKSGRCRRTYREKPSAR